jgi:putative ABC transport system ATP-binding protein
VISTVSTPSPQAYTDVMSDARDSPGSANTPRPRLEASHIGRRAPFTQKWLLRDISLHVEAGARLAVVGPSGSGKSLLLRALALLDPLDEGAITWRGAPAGSQGVPDYRRQVMYLPQQPALFEGNVEENLKQPFALKIHAGSPFKQDIVVDLIRSVGRSPDFLRKHVNELSGGERQIVVLIRAMQLSPTILLLDEPTASLDDDAKQAVATLLDRWVSDGEANRAIVQVSHDAGQIERTAQQVFEMEGGLLRGSR